MTAKIIQFQWLCNSIKNMDNIILSQIGRHALIWGQKTLIITFYPKIPLKTRSTKFQFVSVFHDLAIEKNCKHFEFRRMGGYTSILIKRVF